MKTNRKDPLNKAFAVIMAFEKDRRAKTEKAIIDHMRAAWRLTNSG